MCVEPVLLDVLNISGTQSTARGFEGCIFRMEIDNVYPLKRAFQDPKPTFVKLYPEGKVKLIFMKKTSSFYYYALCSVNS